MVPVGRLTIVRTFPKSELVRAMAFVAIPALVGPMLGPVVGGAIVHFLSWRVIFFVNLPIGAVGLPRLPVPARLQRRPPRAAGRRRVHPLRQRGRAAVVRSRGMDASGDAATA